MSVASIQARWSHLVGILVLMLAVSGCAHRGDFGRERPNAFTDTLLAVGMVSTHGYNQDIWDFALTDDERTMRDLGWTLMVPTHTEDWIGYTLAMVQNADLDEQFNLEDDPGRYSMMLSGTRYRSSDARYARIQDDAAKDMAAIGPFMTLAQEVRVADQQRIIAAQSLPDITPDEMSATYYRVASNHRHIERVKRAIQFRLYAYRYAVDRLMIQTPSRQANATIERLHALEVVIENALESDSPIDLSSQMQQPATLI